MLPAATQAWFDATHGTPTAVQTRGWAAIDRGEHALLVAPTGSGKTLAAFLACLGRLIETPGEHPPGTRILYVSPIKALAHDIERNLAAPLAGIVAAAAAMGVPAHVPRVDVRTGDTDPRTRRLQLRDPADILVTTPESLYLLLGSAARARLTTVEVVIIDELHALAPTKRGVHLALSLERLAAQCLAATGREPQRIGLSATVRPLDVAARFLGGDRPVTVVDASAPPALDVTITMAPPPPPVGEPAPDAPRSERSDGERGGAWATLLPPLLDDVLAHRQTILFVNSRRLAERLAAQLTELARARGACGPDETLVRAHHGSVARAQRLTIEADLKAGRLRAIAATSSLELGIDMSDVDLVIQLESPGSVARGLQRIGRAGHQVGATSRGRIVPRFRGDLLEAAACVRDMAAGVVEATAMPTLCLDVLAQQVVAMVATEGALAVAEVGRRVRRAASYRDLTPAALAAVLDMLTGRYPSDKLAELRPRLTWDRATDQLLPRAGSRLLAMTNGGTIPDRGLYPVHLGVGGPRIGELDEEMVHESRRGDTFVLGASTWRVEDITRDRVVVSPAPGEPGKMPFWRGDGPGRPVELGRAVGALARELDERLASDAPDDVAAAVGPRLRLDDRGARELVGYVAAQRAAIGAVPTDRRVVIERFRDDVGDWRICVLSPFGLRVHAPWGLAIAHRLEAHLGYPVRMMIGDDGIALRVVDGDETLDPELLVPPPDELRAALTAELPRSARFATLFRENAARALLLPRQRPGGRTPLWAQRQRAHALLGVARGHAEFPIVLETFRECLNDVFDVPALEACLRGIADGEVRLETITSGAPSPFAATLVFGFVATFLYDGDAPVAERQAQALALDHRLLGELLGVADARAALPDGEAGVAALADVLAQVGAFTEHGRASSADQLADLLRRLGDLSVDDLRARAGADLDVDATVRTLAAQGRAAAIVVAGVPRWIAADDAARYAALAVPGTDVDPLSTLLARWARHVGPFAAADVVTRWGVEQPRVDAALAALVHAGEVVPLAGDAPRFVAPDLLARVRTRARAILRLALAPVPSTTLARWLPRWHQLGAGRRGLPALRDALTRLAGLALPFAELEASVLPARVADYAPRLLDELGALGEIVWVGAGAIGAKDGRVRIVARADAHLIASAAPPPTREPIHAALVAHLRERGASFLVSLEATVAAMTTSSGARVRTEAALWDLIWDGVITNDTFAPLRARRVRTRRGATPLATFAGRWSLATEHRGGPTSAAALAARALDRWGVIARETALADGLPGGLAALLPVLDAMETSGAVQRGLFVDGLGGRQYALPRALDELRRALPGTDVVALATSDPANPWGALFAWPPLTSGERPTRRATSTLVMVNGVPTLLHDAGAGRLSTFLDASPASIELALRRGLAPLTGPARRGLAIRTVDGAPALTAPLAPVLDAVGCIRDHRGFMTTARPA